MSAGVRVTYKDEGLRKILESLEQLGQLRVTAGVQGDRAAATYPDGTSVGAVAKFMEFGTRTIPARPFLRHAAMTSEPGIASVAAASVGEMVTRGTSPEDALRPVGELVARQAVQAIDRSRGWARPDSAATVAAKGSSQPLYDTGRLRDSITWAVRDGRVVVKEGA